MRGAGCRVVECKLAHIWLFLQLDFHSNSREFAFFLISHLEVAEGKGRVRDHDLRHAELAGHVVCREAEGGA